MAMIMPEPDIVAPGTPRDVDRSGTPRDARPYRERMRWRALFADLESQLDAAQARDRLADVADLTRAERAGVALVDRLRAHGPEPLTLVLRDGERVHGRVLDVGPGWLLVADADGPGEHLVPVAAVATVAGLVAAAAPPPGVVMSRLTLGHALRVVARDRAVVRLRTDAGTLVARVDAVGRDHLDAAVVHADSGRPTGERRVVPWSAVLLLSRL